MYTVWRAAVPGFLLVSLVSCSEPDTGTQSDANPARAGEESPPLTLRRASSPDEALRRLPVSVGDKVRVASSMITDELPFAGMVGEVIEVRDSGSSATVYVEELDREFSMSSNLLELIDLPVGTEISMGDRRWVNNPDGKWIETESDR